MNESIPGVRSDPEILGGDARVRGHTGAGASDARLSEHDRPLAEFLDDFPTVDRALAVGVIEHLKRVVPKGLADRGEAG